MILYEKRRYKKTPKFNEESDELTFSASDNEDAPDSPILLQTEYKINPNV